MRQKNTVRIATLLLCCCVSISSYGAKPVKFAIVSDLHAADMPDGAERMQTFIDAANREKVDFIIELGDFCRLDSASQPILKIWNSFKGEKYNVIGNHDMDSYTVDEYTEGMGMAGRYYYFDRGDFRFIVLDGNNLYDGEKYTHYSRGNYYVDRKMRAFMDPEQMSWLKKTLASTDKRCILFSHQSADRAMGNRADVQRILKQENERAGFQKIVVAFSGHNHSNYTDQIEGITYIQMNSASYVWIGKPTMTEERFSKEINDRFSLMKYSVPYDQTLYGIVTVSRKGLKMKGTEAEFMAPSPQDLGIPKERNGYPLVSWIRDVTVRF